MRTRTLFILLLLTLGVIAVVAWSDSELDANSDAAKVPPKTAATAANGAKQAAVHSAAVKTPPIVPFIHTLQVGKTGPTVFQMQRALKAAGFRKGKATGTYGKPTAHEVANFQRHVKIPPSGRYGLRTHRKLSKYYDAAGRARLIAVAHARRIVAITTAIIRVTAHAWIERGIMNYSESASRGVLPRYPGVPRNTDCSGYVTWVYHSVGLPDPNGLNYNPVGWTGTLGRHGVVVPAMDARIGDLALYGGGYPFGHTAIVVHIHPTLVSSHGSPGIGVLPINYRPLSQLRRFF